MVDEPHEVRATLDLIGRCLAGDAQAAAEFQATYGELIYGYPVRVYRTAAEDAGDFYVFAFDRGRIFRRLRTFEGRAPLRAYLLGFVLDDLVLEWKRGQREIETISLEVIGELPDMNASMNHSDVEGANTAKPLTFTAVLAGIEPSKAVVMKLLHVEDCDLEPAEIRYLADVSGRSVAEVLKAVDDLRATVRERESAAKQIEDALDAVQAWIQLYERRLRRVNDDLASPVNPGVAERLHAEQVEMEHKIRRRHQQRAKLLARRQRRKVTAPYKEIAGVLNTTVGNVASKIARLRQELAQKAGGTMTAGETGDSDD
jgi:DNA-directed RNA polymerase specialized sigma24 family protein